MRKVCNRHKNNYRHQSDTTTNNTNNNFVEIRIRDFVCVVFVLCFVCLQIKHGLLNDSRDRQKDLNDSPTKLLTITEEGGPTTTTIQPTSFSNNHHVEVSSTNSSNLLMNDSSSNNNNTTNHDTTTNDSSNNTTDEDANDDWFERTKWKPNIDSNKCFYLENFCHWNQHWFYDTTTTTATTTTHNKSSNSDNAILNRHQPKNLVFKFRKFVLNKGTSTLPKLYPDIIQVEDSMHNVAMMMEDETEEEKKAQQPRHKDSDQPLHRQQKQCYYSPITNHLVLHSNFNHMLGEFYTRTLYGVYDMIVNDIHGNIQRHDVVDGHDVVDDHDDQNLDLHLLDRNFVTNTQFYIHMKVHGSNAENTKHQILESHLFSFG